MEAAIYELEVGLDDETIESGSFDAEPWDHVKHTVHTEDKLRRWSGSPIDRQGRTLTGKDLFLKALGADGTLPLGSQPNDKTAGATAARASSRRSAMSTGTTIQERDDLRRYAMGVVGLASLLLTQIQHQHPGAVH